MLKLEQRLLREKDRRPQVGVSGVGSEQEARDVASGRVMFRRFEPGWGACSPGPHTADLATTWPLKLCASGWRGRSVLPHGAATDRPARIIKSTTGRLHFDMPTSGGVLAVLGTYEMDFAIRKPARLLCQLGEEDEMRCS